MIKVPSSIVSCEWLKEHLKHENLIVLDATIPKVTAKTKQESSDQKRIPTAKFFDIKKDFSHVNAVYPNTMLSSKVFEQKAQALGIFQDSCVVVYDSHGIYSSPRAWFMFKSMGFDNIAVLNGGLPAWKEKGFDTDDHYQEDDQKGNFKAKSKDKYFLSSEDVVSLLDSDEYQILDARSEARFLGVAPEPREGVRSGHIPNSKSFPYSSLLSGSELKSSKELKRIYEELNVKNSSMIFSCGTGITACVLALGAETLGYVNYAVYDGSWTEWGSRVELPIEK